MSKDNPDEALPMRSAEGWRRKKKAVRWDVTVVPYHERELDVLLRDGWEPIGATGAHTTGTVAMGGSTLKIILRRKRTVFV